jgi:hypothetical protein
MREWKEERIAYLLNNPNLEVLLDSGAFSALNIGSEIDLQEYITFLRQWGGRLFGYMLLDKLGDVNVTARNYETMLDAGLHPIPIHVRGDNEERMNYLFDRSAYVALGGFRRPKRGWSSKGYVSLKMNWAAGRPVHWLGYTRQDMLPIYRPYSCDSANIMSGAMYGLVMTFDRGRIRQYDRPKIMEMNTPPVPLARALAGVGARWQDLKDSRSWRVSKRAGQRYVEHLPHLICAWSYCQYARWAAQNLGVRVFMATTNVYQTVDIISKFANEMFGGDYPIAPDVQDPVRRPGQWA